MLEGRVLFEKLSTRIPQEHLGNCSFLTGISLTPLWAHFPASQNWPGLLRLPHNQWLQKGQFDYWSHSSVRARLLGRRLCKSWAELASDLLPSFSICSLLSGWWCPVLGDSFLVILYPPVCRPCEHANCLLFCLPFTNPWILGAPWSTQ